MDSFTTEVSEDEVQELARMDRGTISALARDCLKFQSFIPLINAIETIMIPEPWAGNDRRQGERRRA